MQRLTGSEETRPSPRRNRSTADLLPLSGRLAKAWRSLHGYTKSPFPTLLSGVGRIMRRMKDPAVSPGTPLAKIPLNLVPERLVQQNPQTRPVRLVVLDALHVQFRHHGGDEHELRQCEMRLRIGLVERRPIR